MNCGEWGDDCHKPFKDKVDVVELLESGWAPGAPNPKIGFISPVIVQVPAFPHEGLQSLPVAQPNESNNAEDHIPNRMTRGIGISVDARIPRKVAKNASAPTRPYQFRLVGVVEDGVGDKVRVARLVWTMNRCHLMVGIPHPRHDVASDARFLQLDDAGAEDPASSGQLFMPSDRIPDFKALDVRESRYLDGRGGK